MTEPTVQLNYNKINDNLYKNREKESYKFSLNKTATVIEEIQKGFFN